MQVSEFKAWFAGFTEAVAKVPTEKQWARIRGEVDELDGTQPITQPLPILGLDYPAPYVFPGPNWSTTGGTDAARAPNTNHPVNADGSF